MRYLGHCDAFSIKYYTWGLKEVSSGFASEPMLTLHRAQNYIW